MIDSTAAGGAQSAFLSSLSHEVRTPLTAILGFAELLADDRADDPLVVDAVEVIRRNATSLLRLMDTLLEMAEQETRSAAAPSNRSTQPDIPPLAAWRISPLPCTTRDVGSSDGDRAPAMAARASVNR